MAVTPRSPEGRRLLWNVLPIGLVTVVFLAVYGVSSYRFHVDPLHSAMSANAAWGLLVVNTSAFVALTLSSLVMALRGHRLLSVVPAVAVAVAPLTKGGVVSPYFENWSLKAPPWLADDVAIGVAVLIVIPALLARPSRLAPGRAVDRDVWRRCALLCALVGLGLVVAQDNIRVELVDPQVHVEALITAFLVGVSTQAWKVQWRANLLLAFLLSPFISSMLMPLFGDEVYWRWAIGGLIGFLVILAVGSASHPIAVRWSQRGASPAAVDTAL